MSTTTTDYLSIANNLARYQKVEASKATVKTATAYYQANIGKVKSIDQFIGDFRLLSYALQAFGLGDQINNRALIRKVLQQGVTSPKALANTLPNVNWKKFAAAFNFAAKGTSAPSSSASVATTTSDYTQQQLEADQGAANPGVELAMYFARVGPTITSSLQILADSNLLETVQTIFNLPSTASASQLDRQTKAIEKLMPVKDLQDPKKLKSLVERFTAAYDVAYGPGGSNVSTPLTVKTGNKVTTVTASSSILSGIVSANSQSYGGTDFSASLMSLAGLKLGG